MPAKFCYADFERLKFELERINEFHNSAMEYYVSTARNGFRHHRGRDKASCSCTSTCISSLVVAGKWPETLIGRQEEIANALLLREEWKSAGLDKENPFTVSFICEGILDLAKLGGCEGSCDKIKKLKARAVPILVSALDKHDPPKFEVGSISMKPYPPSGYLTQLVFRVLVQLVNLKDDQKRSVREWATREVARQIALLSTASKNADPLQLAYAIILSASAQPSEEATPEDQELRSQGLRLFFDCQRDDGSWPFGKPLFHYPKYGNAYCFEYELLAQLLSCRPLWDDLFAYMPKLEKAVRAAMAKKYELPSNEGEGRGLAWAWSSGHHPQLSGPESWSTASVYHFSHALERLVAEGLRRAVYDELGEQYVDGPRDGGVQKGKTLKFAEEILDSPLYDPSDPSKRLSLKKTLEEKFIAPLINQRPRVEKGLKIEAPISAILYGPPGTSKTTYAEKISDHLGWPLLALDPSHLVDDGIDNIHAAANRIFRMLSHLERVVVLLDEFDELGRERQKSNEMLSRLITTTMLPKLIKINKSRKIVFLLATNFVTNFDSAFSRRGRFDLMLQVLPPSFDEKIKNWPTLHEKYKNYNGKNKNELKNKIELLTYDETHELSHKLESAGEFEGAVYDSFNSSTMNHVYDSNIQSSNSIEEITSTDTKNSSDPTAHIRTWETVCEKEREYLRLP